MSTLNSYATAPGAQSGCEDRRVRSIERSKAGLFETLAAAAAARDKAVAALKELNLDVGSAKADALVAELESILTP